MKEELLCQFCGAPCDWVFVNTNVVPVQPMCEECAEEKICACGRVAESDGMCSDCIDEVNYLYQDYIAGVAERMRNDYSE